MEKENNLFNCQTSLVCLPDMSTVHLAIIMMMGLIQHPRVGDDWDYGVCDRWNSSEF